MAGWEAAGVGFFTCVGSDMNFHVVFVVFYMADWAGLFVGA